MSSITPGNKTRNITQIVTPTQARKIGQRMQRIQQPVKKSQPNQ